MERVMTAGEVAAVARAAGLPEAQIPMAVAVAFYESSWRPGAVGDINNPATGCSSVGLWQVNSCPRRDGSGHPRYGSNPDALKDPLTNAKAMVTISGNGANWKPWAAAPKALEMLARGGPDLASTTTPTIGDGANRTPAAETQFDITGSGTWMRLGNIVGGSALLVLAYFILKADLATGGIL